MAMWFSRQCLFFLLMLATQDAAADIFECIQRDSMEDIRKLLKEDPSALNRVGPGQRTPLMHAVLTGKSSAVKYLLKRKADPTIGEMDGYTPMHGVSG